MKHKSMNLLLIFGIIVMGLLSGVSHGYASSGEKLTWYSAGENENGIIFGAVVKAQTFYLSQDAEIDEVRLKLWRYGTDAGNINVKIVATYSGIPIETTIYTSGTLAFNDVTTDSAGAWYTIALTPYTLTKNIPYAIYVVFSAGTYPAKVLRWLSDYTGYYDRGVFYASSDTGTTWTAFSAKDFLFEIWGVPIAPQYRIILSQNDADGGLVVPSIGTHYFDAEYPATLTAYPEIGYKFSGWFVDGQLMIPMNPWIFSVTSNRTIVATFTSDNVTLIIQNREGGTTSPLPGTYTYPRGFTIMITAIPNDGYNLYNWDINGGINQGFVGLLTLTVYLDQNYIIAPIFTKRIWHYVELEDNEHGDLSLQAGTYFVYVEDPSFSVRAIPDEGYYFDHWLINGTTSLTSNPLVLTINGNSTIKPYFISQSTKPSFTFDLLFSWIIPFIIVGALGFGFSEVGNQLGNHNYAGFLIGGSMGLILCANSGLLEIWFITAVFACGFIAMYFWFRSG